MDGVHLSTTALSKKKVKKKGEPKWAKKYNIVEYNVLTSIFFYEELDMGL